MSFIFGKKEEEHSDSKSDPRLTQGHKAMRKIDLPFARYLGAEAARDLLNDVGIASEDSLFEPANGQPYDNALPPFPEDKAEYPEFKIPKLPPIERVEPDVIVTDPAPQLQIQVEVSPAEPVPEPTPEPEPVPEPEPEPAPVPAPAPAPTPADTRYEELAKSLESLTDTLEKMNETVMTKVDALEKSVQNRSKEIREGFYQSHLNVIDVGRRLKRAMHEAELMDLDIQKKTLEILDTTEDKSLERTAKIKNLGIFGT